MNTTPAHYLFQEAATAAPTLRKYHPYERRFAAAGQGGAALTFGGGESLSIVLPKMLELGEFTSISGTSGFALLAAITAHELNQGHGVEGVIKSFNRLRQLVGNVDDAYGISRMHKMAANPMFCGYLTMMQSFTAAALAQMGAVTSKTKDMLVSIIGDGKHVRNGPVVPYVNYLRHDALHGTDEHIVVSGKDATTDRIVGSGGLDELGNHRVTDWFRGSTEIMRDGAYHGGANPAITPMIEDQRPTDVVVFTLHGPANRIKPAREQNLYTTEIHGELALLRQQYKGRVNFHTIHLDFGDLDHMSGDHEHLRTIAAIARQQTLEQLPGLLRSFDQAPRVRFDSPSRPRGQAQPPAHLAGVA